jgi:hypothetical protein
MMGWNIPGHGQCIICHPDLVRGWAKKNAKGMKKLPHAVAVASQESTRLLDLLARAEQESFSDDET